MARDTVVFRLFPYIESIAMVIFTFVRAVISLKAEAEG